MTRSRTDADTFGAEAFAEAMGVSRETLERFEVWRALLARWNAKVNLVGPSTLAQFWRRHALDSAQLVDLAPETATRWIDFGSGAGLPGIAIALTLADRGRAFALTVVEANAKKAAFLREAARATGAQVTVAAARLETLTTHPVDVVTARAFAPLDRLLTYAEPWRSDETVGLFLKGKDVDEEIAAAEARWRFTWNKTESRAGGGGVTLRVEDWRRREAGDGAG